MTEAEAEYWDEYFTRNEPVLGPNGSGFLSAREARLLGLDDFAYNYLYTKSIATHSSLGQVINALVRKEVQGGVAAA
jgi:hypothetical protein